MRPLKAIVIDDDRPTLQLLRAILEHRLYEVETYQDPVRSPLFMNKVCPCSLHDTQCPDLIITDLSMPQMNGVDLLEFNMKKGCRCRHLALMTGKELKEEFLTRLAKYGTRFFLKPLNLDDFYPWLDRVEAQVAGHLPE